MTHFDEAQPPESAGTAHDGRNCEAPEENDDCPREGTSATKSGREVAMNQRAIGLSNGEGQLGSHAVG